ncbi:MAG TPA: hypothetical protein VK698_22535 [Kofleriaceae bacterium]|nr:hypothetical protein [Kofleriaceae bacterium]
MTVTAQAFVDERIILDGHTYDGCTFERCELVFNGAAPTVLTNNSIVDCTWRFEGSAAVTLAFLRALVEGGAADLVRNTLGVDTPGASGESSG